MTAEIWDISDGRRLECLEIRRARILDIRALWCHW